MQLRNSTSEFVHVSHPCAVKWRSIVGYISATLGVPLVSYSEWLQRLEQTESTQSPTKVHALRLIDYYRAISKADLSKLEVAGVPKFATDNAQKGSSVLSDPGIKQIGEEDMQKWLDYWRSSGLLSF